MSVAPLGAGAWVSDGASADGDSPDTSEHWLGTVDDVTGGDGDDPAPGDSGSLGSVVALALYPPAITTVHANTAAVNRFNVIMTPLVRPQQRHVEPTRLGSPPVLARTVSADVQHSPTRAPDRAFLFGVDDPDRIATDLGSVAGL